MKAAANEAARTKLAFDAREESLKASMEDVQETLKLAEVCTRHMKHVFIFVVI